jgi:N-acetylmuramoyl-L-alanine amidase
MVKLKRVFFTAALVIAGQCVFAQNFKVFLDPGHGGHDTGTNHNGYVEKDIVLTTCIKIGQILEREPGIDVVFTRKSDVFIELRERANMANRAKADLYVSIHCNGVNAPAAYGTETFVMGHDRSAMNLEVAKQENSVIYKEANYKEKYKGFNPNKPEFSIGLSVQQEENINYSAILASKVSKGFKSLNKHDRGIKQVPLWVLDATTMPGVLIELGFVSNKKEGAYLNSEEGQDELARTIANAIISYKNLMTGKGGKESDAVKKEVAKAEIDTASTKRDKAEAPSKENNTKIDTAEGVVFKVQISASSRDLATKSANFKGLKNISKIKDGKLVKYFYGNVSSYDEAEKLLDKAKDKGYGSAYIVAFRNGNLISIKEALK